MIKYPLGVIPPKKAVNRAVTASQQTANEQISQRIGRSGSSPNTRQIQPESIINFGKRGMNFEAEINATNDYYLSHGIAVIHKKPTPIQVVKVEYPKRSKAKITEAYYRQASTTDYSGVYKGHYLDFEAKETQQKLSFPLKNFHKHQINHMKAVLAQNGIAFTLLHFATADKTYFLPSSALIDFYEGHHGLKSMPLAYIQTHGQLVDTQQIPRIPYIDIINKKLGRHSYASKNSKTK